MYVSKNLALGWPPETGKPLLAHPCTLKNSIEQKMYGIPNNGCVLSNFFDQNTHWLSRAIFHIIEAGKSLQVNHAFKNKRY